MCCGSARTPPRYPGHGRSWISSVRDLRSAFHFVWVHQARPESLARILPLDTQLAAVYAQTCTKTALWPGGVQARQRVRAREPSGAFIGSTCSGSSPAASRRRRRLASAPAPAAGLRSTASATTHTRSPWSGVPVAPANPLPPSCSFKSSSTAAVATPTRRVAGRSGGGTPGDPC